MIPTNRRAIWNIDDALGRVPRNPASVLDFSHASRIGDDRVFAFDTLFTAELTELPYERIGNLPTFLSQAMLFNPRRANGMTP
jgi:hypothetical protein